MTERADFLRAICAAPADDAPRLVYADWLDEAGEWELAEYIRVGCELAVLVRRQRTGTATRDDSARHRDLFHRECELKLTVYPRYIRPVFDWLRERDFDPEECVFNRGGFLDMVVSPADAWLAHAAELRAAQPVRGARLTTRPNWFRWPGPCDRCRECRAGVFDACDGYTRELGERWPGVAFDLSGVCGNEPGVPADRLAAVRAHQRAAFWRAVEGRSQSG
jgi:uncharacterized protein (TIGR02996 family)